MEKVYLVFEYNEILDMRACDLVGVYSSKDKLKEELESKGIKFKEKSGRFGEDAFKSEDEDSHYSYQVYEVSVDKGFNQDVIKLYEGLKSLSL